MKKHSSLLFLVILICVLCVCLVACSKGSQLSKFTGITFSDLSVNYDGNEHEIVCSGVPDGAKVVYSNNKATEDGEYNATATISQDGYETLKLSAKLNIVLTAQQVVDARSVSVSAAQQNYDFKINLAGTLSLGGFAGTANANYVGLYRYNSSNSDLKFKRTTSGALLYDSIEYIYNTGSSKVKLVANEDGVVKRTSVVPQQDEELNLLNIPFAAIIDHTDANNLTKITKLSSGDYKYKANLALASDNADVQKVISLLGKLGTTVEMGDVAFSNPTSGIEFFFNLSADKSKLTDFMYSAMVQFPIKGVDTTLTLAYEQKASDAAIVIPSTAGLLTSSSEIATEMSVINSAFSTIKNSDTYSLDLEATNEFDPGWSTNAIVDKYYSRLYKNTNDARVDFNQSFEYKAHSEADGAETYKYTYGNIQDGSVYLVSRKGTNTITEATGVTVNSQFDYMTDAAILDAANVDCIKKVVDGQTTKYYIYMKTATILSIKDTITGIINSNNADGVVDVDNYFNSTDYIIRDAEMVITMVSGKISTVTIDTELRYCPTSGDYTEAQITLTNSISLSVDVELDKATEYEAPSSTTTGLHLGLNNAKFYIR